MKTYLAISLLCALLVAQPAIAQAQSEAPQAALAQRRAHALGLRRTGQALLAVGVIHAVAALALIMTDLVTISPSKCANQGCFYDTGPVFAYMGTGILIPGSVLIGIGAPLYSMGTRTLHSLSGPDGEARALAELAPKSREQLLYETRRSMENYRTGLIISGVAVGASVAMMIAGGAAYAAYSSAPFTYGGYDRQMGAEAAIVAGGVLTGMALFPFVYFAHGYVKRSALLSRPTPEPETRLSVAPILSPSLYGLGFTGTF